MLEKHDELKIVPDYYRRLAKYRWEFLRRNPEYIKSWKSLQKSLKESCKGNDVDRHKVTIEEIKFSKKWKISGHVDPKLSFDEILTTLKKNSKKNLEIKNILRKELPFLVYDDNLLNDLDDFSSYTALRLSSFPEPYNTDLYNDILVEFLSRWDQPLIQQFMLGRSHKGKFHPVYTKKLFRDNGKIALSLNLNYPKTLLMQEFKIFIDEWKQYYEDTRRRLAFEDFCKQNGYDIIKIDYILSDENFEDLAKIAKEFKKWYKEEKKKSDKKYKRKYHLDNYDIYLKVYDMKKAGASWSKIEKELNLNSLQTARNHYKAAEKIIKEGIRLYNE